MNNQQHQVTQQTLSPQEKIIQERVQQHQASAPRLTSQQDARTIVEYATGFAVLSTIAKNMPGFPAGAVVGFATDDKGLPFFCFSSLSSHTQDLLQEPENAPASLTITAKNFKGAADGRVTLMGRIRKCSSDEAGPLREVYLAKHPNAFWVDFGDFTWFRMHQLEAVRFVGGFARAGKVTADEYLSTAPDTIQAFADPVLGHMNEDHMDSNIAMVEHHIGLDQVDKATLVGLDCLGLTVLCERLGQSFKLRLPFSRAAEDRKDVKALIVELSRACAK